MWVAGIELFIVLVLVAIVLWAMRQPEKKRDD